ncbi:MAG: aldehyde dehydrogenase [Elusimicrobia bacterium]|nr:aldehyde dehydrogenase [Elusimicrobiota bacterium]
MSITLSPTRLTSRSPITGAVIGEYPRTSREAIHAAVARARRAFPGWKRLSFRARSRLLEAVCALFVREASQWAEAITCEIGKPLAEAYGAEVGASLEALRTLIRQGASWVAPQRARRNLQDWIRGVQRAQLIYEPVGVIGVIGTWNYPLLINLLQISSALFCGNVVVWKPSELALGVAHRLDDLFQRAGFPEGVFTTLPGDAATGEALVRAGCDKVIFTGHGQTGRRILAGLAEQGIPAIMELSGMDAALVLEDAPLAQTIRAVRWGTMCNAGQSCVACRRLIVHRTLAPTFVPALVSAVRSLHVGDPRDPATEIGPVRTPELLNRLEWLIHEAVQKGARVLTGGHRVDGRAGYFFEPTVLTDVTDSMAVLREEYFGPMAVIQEAGDDTEMVTLANASAYGLGASLWTANLPRAEALARELHAGIVWINDVIWSAADIRVPFGGVKGSGFGRVHGPEGLRQLMQVKWIETCRPRGFRPYYFPYGQAKVSRLCRYLRWRHLGRT